MPTIKIVTTIHAPPEICFDLSRDLDLHQKSLAHTSEEAIGGKTAGLIELGEQVTWRGRHFGLMLTHTAEITLFERPHRFRDEMVNGRFQSFVHDHIFEPIPAGTRMTDVIVFASPFWLLGQLVDALVLKRYLTNLIQQRNAVIKEVAENPNGA